MESEIINLKNKTGAGNDGIQSETLKSMINNAIEPFTYIIHLGAKECVYPNAFKKG